MNTIITTTIDIDDITHNFMYDQMVREMLNPAFTAQREYEMELQRLLHLRDLRDLAASAPEETEETDTNNPYVFEL